MSTKQSSPCVSRRAAATAFAALRWPKPASAVRTSTRRGALTKSLATRSILVVGDVGERGEPLLERVERCLGPTRQVELAENVAHVCSHCRLGDHQPIGYLLVREPPRDQLE